MNVIACIFSTRKRNLYYSQQCNIMYFKVLKIPTYLISHKNTNSKK